jgi:hypothetical protein
MVLTNDTLSLERKLGLNIGRHFTRARCGGILRRCTCLPGVGSLVYLSRIWDFGGCALVTGTPVQEMEIDGRERVRPSTCMRIFAVLGFFGVPFPSDVPAEYPTENEDNGASQSPTND